MDMSDGFGDLPGASGGMYGGIYGLGGNDDDEAAAEPEPEPTVDLSDDGYGGDTTLYFEPAAEPATE